MYSDRDFRFLIENKPDEAIRAISREPFMELLSFWKENGKPSDKYKYYNLGIRDAISKGRYPLIHLNAVKDFPEFYPSVRDGLSKYWSMLRFSLLYNENSTSLYIDSLLGQDIHISNDDKLNILQILGSKYSFNLMINGYIYLVGFFLSDQAEAVVHKFHWLQFLTYISEMKN